MFSEIMFSDSTECGIHVPRKHTLSDNQINCKHFILPLTSKLIPSILLNLLSNLASVSSTWGLMLFHWWWHLVPWLRYFQIVPTTLPNNSSLHLILPSLLCLFTALPASCCRDNLNKKYLLAEKLTFPTWE